MQIGKTNRAFSAVRTLVRFVLIIAAVIQIVFGIYLLMNGDRSNAESIPPLAYMALGVVMMFVGVKFSIKRHVW